MLEQEEEMLKQGEKTLKWGETLKGEETLKGRETVDRWLYLV